MNGNGNGYYLMIILQSFNSNLVVVVVVSYQSDKMFARNMKKLLNLNITKNFLFS